MVDSSPVRQEKGMLNVKFPDIFKWHYISQYYSICTALYNSYSPSALVYTFFREAQLNKSLIFIGSLRLRTVITGTRAGVWTFTQSRRRMTLEIEQHWSHHTIITDDTVDLLWNKIIKLPINNFVSITFGNIYLKDLFFLKCKLTTPLLFLTL